MSDYLANHKCKVCGSTKIKYSNLTCKPYLCVDCGVKRDSQIQIGEEK